MKHCRNFIVTLTLFAFLIPAQSAKADVAPPPAPILSGLEPFQYQDTKVQMVYERVEMEVQTFDDPESDHESNRVSVTASFVMHNQGTIPETMQAMFPLESLTNCLMGYGGGNSYTNYFVDEDSFEIDVDGVAVPTQKIITDHPYKDQFSSNFDVCTKMNWVGFNVQFPVDTDVTIKVSYEMKTMGGADAMQNINYVLETGAGWYGPIERAYVIVKLPYMVSSENILEATTPDYQTLYNEIFWSFQKLEPIDKNNIRVSIITPSTWQKVQTLRKALKENPSIPEKWLELAQTYQAIATWKVDFVRSFYYFDQVSIAYEKGITANPNNAELYAQYAMFKLENISSRMGRVITEEEAKPIVALYNKAKALDPKNKTMQLIQSYLPDVAPFLTLTPPPTIPPTATPAISNTPTETPSPSNTPRPSQTPIIEKVIVTKIVTATPEKPTVTATATVSPSSTLTPSPASGLAQTTESGSNWILWPILLLAGFVGGVFISKKKWI